MDGWSFAFSTAALVISVATAYLSWSAHRRDRERRADEMRPSLVAEIEEMNPDSDAHWYRLHLRLRTPWDLAKVHATIVGGKGLSFTGSQLGVDPAAPYPVLSASGGPLRPGEDLTWRVHLDDERESEARLRIDCSDRHGRRWTVVVDVDVPYDPLTSIH